MTGGRDIFPLRDIHKPARRPWITRLLMGVNFIMFGCQWMAALQGDGANIVAALGVHPACFTAPGTCGISLPEGAERLWQPLVASMFLHGGFWHLAFNMLFLGVFGPGVEDRLGRLRFPIFYLGCGIFATLAHIATHPASNVAVIGASGAIAGVLGAYLILLPRSWILTYFPPLFLFPLPAVLFLLLWIAGQVAGGLAVLPGFNLSSQGSDVAWMAHIAGFAVGAAAGWSIKPSRRRKAPTKV